MSISAVTSPMPALLIARAPEAKEGPGRDHDGDGDDVGASTRAATPAAAPQGMGAAVNTKA
jgi:hypothetical protein